MSGQPAYADTTRLPGAITTSPPALAAMERESFPPSQARPSSSMASRMATAASYMEAPSWPILAAYIQFTLALISGREVTAAQVRLVSASPSARRAIAAGLMSPLYGCSPMAVASPVRPKWDCACTATSATGSCRGPTHCCCATRPVTQRSTLVVRNRLLPTAGSRSTLSSASSTYVPSGSERGWPGDSGWRWNLKVLLGILPSTFSRSRSTGMGSSGGASGSRSVMRPLPLMLPSTCMLQRSRAQMLSSTPRSSGLISRQSFSWYSAPQISSTDIVSSPNLIWRTSISAPSG
mmetsp:Transcript_1434/g.4268  ORF Transcript_1434/g.4268 Transcript_1434/m.4268 type:complete len:293 (+) Transcript_1434:630-1508(+)